MCNQGFVEYHRASEPERKKFDEVRTKYSDGLEATVIVEGKVICNYRCNECVFNHGIDMTVGK